jgi:hypothetical protein
MPVAPLPPGLPNAAAATVAPEKLTRYLLDFNHPDGGPKARFFIARGFSHDVPDEFAAALIAHAQTARLLAIRQSTFGAGYDMFGELECPNGETVTIRSGWFVEDGTDVPRLITAYPG